MYIMSFKLNRTKLLVFAAVCAVIVFTLIWASPKAELVNAPKVKDVTIKTQEDREAFLKSFGWEIVSEPVEVMEIIIPSEFDNVYEQYNYIQKLQGYDLAKYKGKRVKRWTYKITNYPGKQDETVNANLLIFNEKVIGGDVCSTALGGFIHGFEITTGSNSKAALSSADSKAGTSQAGKSTKASSGKSSKSTSKAVTTGKDDETTGEIGEAITYGVSQ